MLRYRVIRVETRYADVAHTDEAALAAALLKRSREREPTRAQGEPRGSWAAWAIWDNEAGVWALPR